MTRITWDAAENRMEFYGHANYRARGMDLVCAGASMLMMTLVQAVEDRQDDFRPRIDMQDGHVAVQCEPKDQHRHDCALVMRTIYTGCRLLAEEYPQHVRAIKIQEG